MWTEFSNNFLTVEKKSGKTSTRKLIRLGIEPGPAETEAMTMSLDHSSCCRGTCDWERVVIGVFTRFSLFPIFILPKLSAISFHHYSSIPCSTHCIYDCPMFTIRSWEFGALWDLGTTGATLDPLSMGGSPGELSEELVMQETRKKGWRINCDVDEATEGLENELWRR